MESDNFDSHVERGIAECDGAISNASEASSAEALAKAQAPVKTDSVSSKKKTFPINMPSFEDILKNKAVTPHPPVQNIGKEFVSKIVEKISDSHQQDRSVEIPSFDLGRQILAGQRKAAALKRKSPLSINNSSGVSNLPSGIPRQPKADKTSRLIQTIAADIHFTSASPASPQQRIIADIVAREILILSAAR